MVVMDVILAVAALSGVSVLVVTAATYSYHIKKLRTRRVSSDDLDALRDELTAIRERLDTIDERLADDLLRGHDAQTSLPSDTDS